MKYCEECGQKIGSNDKYCPKCGKSFILVKTSKDNKETLGTISMIFGVISLILSFVINLLIFPLALSGFIIGVVNKAQSGKKISGIILNALAMFIAIVVFITCVLIVIFSLVAYYDEEENTDLTPSVQEEILGTWNCKEVIGLTNNTYDLTILLNNDNTFSIYKYDDKKDYVEGTYEFTDEGVRKITKSYKLYSLDLNGYKEYENNDFKANVDKDYEMVITKTKKDLHAVFNIDDIDKPYYCTK